MIAQKLGRGRPKGTGLNDAAHLQAIAGLIANNPDLKPTTAIRTLGFNDPSVIRRLRDKYSAFQKSAAIKPATPIQSCGSPITDQLDWIVDQPKAASVAPVGLPASASVVASKAAPVAPSFALVSQSPAATAIAAPLLPSSVSAPQDEANWFGVGLRLCEIGMQAQFSVADQMFQWPTFSAVLKSQLAFTELAVVMSSCIARPRTLQPGR